MFSREPNEMKTKKSEKLRLSNKTGKALKLQATAVEVHLPNMRDMWNEKQGKKLLKTKSQMWQTGFREIPLTEILKRFN